MSAFDVFRKAAKERDLLDVFEEVCRERRVRLEAAFGPEKTKAVVRTRAACWARMRKLGFSFPEIADVWGRDHTTIIAAVRGHDEREGDNAAEAEATDPRMWRLPKTERELRERVIELESRVGRLEAILGKVSKALL